MAVRIFNSCTNTHYLTEMGIEGITINVNDGKDTRHVCACGWVDKGDIDTCPKCGNKHWVFVSANNWSRSSVPVYIKSKEPVIRPIGSGFEIIETALKVFETSAKQLNLAYEDFSTLEVDLWKLDYKNRPRVSINNDIDITKYLIEHIGEITDEAIRDTILDAVRVSSGIWGGNNYLAMAYKLIGYPCVMHLLTDENIAKYARFFKESFNRNEWNRSDPFPGNTCLTMKEFWALMGLPEDYAAYYASDSFSYSYYYYRSSEDKIEPAKLHALPIELQRTMKSCLEHKTITLQTIRSILSWSDGQSEKTLVLLAKFMKRHGMQYQGRVFDRFKEYLSLAHDMGYDEESILQPRRFSMLEAMTLLKRRGYPDSRVSAFCDIFDLNPSVGLGLLGSKAQLKKDEADKIYNR